MTREFEKMLSDIRKQIEDHGKFYRLEKNVKEYIVVAVLTELSWERYQIRDIQRERSTREGRRVDLALCDNNGDPKVFIEVKRLGLGDTEEAKKQAWDYAVDANIPLVVVTDGKKWSFYLLAEEGGYEDRCFCRLNLSESSLPKSCDILHKYLDRSKVISKKAVIDAEGVLNARMVLPDAWTGILQRKKDYPLLKGLIGELVAEVERRVGVPPDDNEVIDFLQSLESKNYGKDTRQPRPKSERGQSLAPSSVPPGRKATATKAVEYPDILVRGNKKPRSKGLSHELLQAFFTGKNARRKLTYDDAVRIGIEGGHDANRVKWQLRHYLLNRDYIRFDKQAQRNGGERKSKKSRHPRAGELVILGKFHSCRNQNNATEIVFDALQEKDRKFLQRFYKHPKNQKSKYKGRRGDYRYLGQNYQELFGDNEGKPRSFVNIRGGWVVSADYNWEKKKKIIQLAAEVAGLEFGRDIILNFDD